MQINFDQLSIAKIFKLSKHIKEKCKNHSSFEEVVQELMRVFYGSFVAEDGRSPFVLARFFKICTYGELPDDIRDHIHNKESKEDLISDRKYLTLLGSFGELDNWKNRRLSENYKAFPIHDKHMLDKFPMLSAVFDQIGLKLSSQKQTDKSIIIKDGHRQYGVFCVENAESSKLIPKQAEFVRPYSVKSVFGFGGIYSTSNAYAVLVFSRERLSRKDAQLFLSLNPAIKQVTLAHEITGNIFEADIKNTNSSVDGLCIEIPTVKIKFQNKTISPQHKDIIEKEMALTSNIELEMVNEYLLGMSEALKESHVELDDKERAYTYELKESKEQIQLLLNSTGEAIYGLDNNGNCTFSNVACLKILGYKNVSQLIGKNMHDLIHHTKKDGTPYPIEECCIYQAFREGKGTHVDCEVLWRADGTCFSAEYMSYPIHRDNKIIGAVVTFYDITARKKAEEEIKGLAKFPSENPNPVIRVFNNGNILYNNKASTFLFDSWDFQTSGRLPEKLIKMVSDVLHSGLSSTTEIECKDRIISLTFTPIVEEGYVNIYGLDITERKKADEEIKRLNEFLETRVIERTELLRESKERFRSLVENTTDWIWEVDEQIRYTYASPQVRELLGYEPDEVIGMTPFDLMTPENQKGVRKLFIENAERREPLCRLENANLHKDGRTVILETSGVPIFGSDGSFKGYRGIDRDITERKKAEQALMQSEKLKSIGIITAGISHEFNNILAIISGNVQILKERYNDHEELTKALCTIKRAVDDGAQISRMMLKFTKTKNNAGGLVSSDIRDLIMHSIDFTKPRWKNEAQARGVNYKIDIEGIKSVPPILGNPTELREVFVNIINNALDAMPEGGSLSFGTWSVEDTVFAGITDTGKGMSEDVKKSIFDPFFTTRTPVGTGLGMSTAYGIITRHGGKIEVESELGKGSKFTLQFPIATRADSPIATPVPDQEANEKNLRILVVDDEAAICDMLDNFLSGSGHKVKTVDNGADAINIIKTESFDLVLCDLSMPNVSGYDVVKVFNGLENRQRIGIITGWGEGFKPVAGDEFKVDFVVRKPFDFFELTKHINDI